MSYEVFNDNCSINVVKGEDGLVVVQDLSSEAGYAEGSFVESDVEGMTKVEGERNLIFRFNVKYLDHYGNKKRGKEYYVINSRYSKSFSKMVRSKLKELKVSSRIDSYTVSYMNSRIYNLKLSKDNYIKLKTLLKIHNGEIVL